MTTRDDIDDLKAATRAAHEMIQELNEAIRDAEKAAEGLRKMVHDQVDDVLSREVRGGLEALGKVVQKACDDATELVYRRFDTITATLLGETKDRRRKGDRSIPEMAEEYAERRKPPPGGLAGVFAGEQVEMDAYLAAVRQPVTGMTAKARVTEDQDVPPAFRKGKR